MRDQNAPRCPDTKRLRALETKLTETGIDSLSANEPLEIIEVLDWLATFLENRKLYHKKMQLKTKHLIALAKERGLDEEATKLANDEVFNIVANEPEEDAGSFEQYQHLKGDK